MNDELNAVKKFSSPPLLLCLTYFYSLNFVSVSSNSYLICFISVLTYSIIIYFVYVYLRLFHCIFSVFVLFLPIFIQKVSISLSVVLIFTLLLIFDTHQSRIYHQNKYRQCNIIYLIIRLQQTDVSCVPQKKNYMIMV